MGEKHNYAKEGGFFMGFTASVTSYDQIRRIGFPLLIVAAAFRVDGLQPCAWIHGKNTMCDIFHRLLISDLKEME